LAHRGYLTTYNRDGLEPFRLVAILFLFRARTMLAEVVLLPALLKPGQLRGRAVAVFDVLRATTSMAAALTAGIPEIQVCPDLASAQSSAAACPSPHLTCGEKDAVKPDGFDLGNSPGAFNAAQHAGKKLFMSTTNGTRAILAAGDAQWMFTAALVNAKAAAKALISTGCDITLLCSGTNGFFSLEDFLGAGAVIEALRESSDVRLESDAALLAQQHFAATNRRELLNALSQTQGGRNVARANLSQDLVFCAMLNSIDVVGIVQGSPPIVRRWEPSR
jgi:2-phosphosulfolactate phosphatase